MNISDDAMRSVEECNIVTWKPSRIIIFLIYIYVILVFGILCMKNTCSTIIISNGYFIGRTSLRYIINVILLLIRCFRKPTGHYLCTYTSLYIMYIIIIINYPSVCIVFYRRRSLYKYARVISKLYFRTPRACFVNIVLTLWCVSRTYLCNKRTRAPTTS